MTFYIDLLMHTGLFIITIPVLYFEFVTRIVTYGLIDNLNYIIDENISKTNFKKILTKEEIQSLLNYLNVQINPKITEINDDYSSDNSYIYILAYSICGGISAICMLLSGILCVLYNENFLTLLFENLIVLSFIILSEFLLVTIFLNKLEIIDGEFLYATFLSSAISPSLWDCPPEWTSRKDCKWGERCSYINKIFPLNLIYSLDPNLL